MQVSSDGGTDSVWKRSGGELFYRNGDSMMAVPVSVSPGSSLLLQATQALERALLAWDEQLVRPAWTDVLQLRCDG